MDATQLRALLEAVKAGKVDVDTAAGQFQPPVAELGYAHVDLHRRERCGFPEVIFGQGKTSEQISGIVERMLEAGSNVLITRTTAEVHESLEKIAPDAVFHKTARAITILRDNKQWGKGKIGIVTAGTSDMPVAEEAAITAEILDAGLCHIETAGDRARL